MAAPISAVIRSTKTQAHQPSLDEKKVVKKGEKAPAPRLWKSVGKNALRK